MRERFTKLQRPIVSLCVLLALLFLFAFLGVDIISAVQLTPIPQGSSVLLLEEWNTLCVFAYSGEQSGSGTLLALERTTGRILSQKTFSESALVWVGLRGNSLFVV